jgi:DnaJ domain
VTQASYYEVLGVSRNASAADIRNAYRVLAMRWHPDRNRNPGALERFKLINIAYQTLSDPESRRHYNARLDSSKGAWQPDEGLSDQQAFQIFLESMMDLGYELAARGRDARYIHRALTEEGCPTEIASAVARSCVRNVSAGGRGAASAKKRMGFFGVMWGTFKGVRILVSLAALLYVVYMLSAVSIMTGNAPKWLTRVWGLIGNDPKQASGIPSGLPALFSTDSAQVNKLADQIKQSYGALDPDAAESDKRAAEPATPKRAAPSTPATGREVSEITWTPAPDATARPIPAPPRRVSSGQPGPAGPNSCNSDQDCPQSMTCNRRSVHEAWRCMPR